MNAKQDFEKWNNTIEQKIWILMKVWAEVHFNFVFFDKVPEINWEKECRKIIPELLATNNIKDFYLILQELLAQLKDGHTFILPPFSVLAAEDRPPLDFQLIENKIIITRVGDSQELNKNNIVPGLEIIKINNCSAKEHLNSNIIRYYQGNTKHWGEVFGLFRLLEGELNSKIEITIKDLFDKTKTVTLTRNSLLSNGQKFTNCFFNFGPIITKRMLNDQIVYFNFSSFALDEIVDDFIKELEMLDLKQIKGMIIDLRSNIGGNSENSYKIISQLIDQSIEGEKWLTRKYLPAFRSWGKPEEWHNGSTGFIHPSKGKKYLGPLVILTSNLTASAAEDFIVPLKYANRATIVGDVTAGTTGNPISFILPGGYNFRVCSVITTFPDGEEFVGIGIKPDIALKATKKDIYDQRDIVLAKAKEMLE
ncbi:MAG: S41 family peptidase [Asgard group archaeon]|nr:S41 family peptidase [Asgard group archaeon]